MDQYMRRYWQLYLDFVDAAGSVRYRGIPLALVSNFYKYLDEATMQRMRSPKWELDEVLAPIEQNRIQPEFERRIETLLGMKPLDKRNGLVALCGSLLRFPESVYYEYFHPAKTVLLNDNPARSERGTVFGLPVHNLRMWGGASADKAVCKVKMLIENRLAPWTERIGKDSEAIRRRFIADVPEMLRLIDQVDRYMSKQPISCIVLGTTEVMLTRVLALVGRRRTIPTICLQHGLIAVEESYMPVFADTLAVYGHADKRWYMDRGVAEERIEVTGHPRFDPIFTQLPGSSQLLARMWPEMMERKRVLIASQPHIDVKVWEEMIRALAKSRELNVLIKPHPLEFTQGRSAYYAILAAKHKNVYTVPSELSLYDLLPHMDAVVVESSTVGLESLLFDRPLFLLKGPYTQIYAGCTGFVANSSAQLRRMILAYFHNAKLRKQHERIGRNFLKSAYPHRISAPIVVGLIERKYGKRCRPRLSWLQEGMLLKAEGPAVYAVQQGMRRHVASPKRLQQIKSTDPFPKVLRIKPEHMLRIPQGEPIR